jgi:hypothetical protein
MALPTFTRAWRQPTNLLFGEKKKTVFLTDEMAHGWPDALLFLLALLSVSLYPFGLHVFTVHRFTHPQVQLLIIGI